MTVTPPPQKRVISAVSARLIEKLNVVMAQADRAADALVARLRDHDGVIDQLEDFMHRTTEGER